MSRKVNKKKRASKLKFKTKKEADRYSKLFASEKPVGHSEVRFGGLPNRKGSRKVHPHPAFSK